MMLVCVPQDGTLLSFVFHAIIVWVVSLRDCCRHFGLQRIKLHSSAYYFYRIFWGWILFVFSVVLRRCLLLWWFSAMPVFLY